MSEGDPRACATEEHILKVEEIEDPTIRRAYQESFIDPIFRKKFLYAIREAKKHGAPGYKKIMENLRWRHFQQDREKIVEQIVKELCGEHETT